MVAATVFLALAASSEFALFLRMLSTRFSTSRTLVRYSSSLPLSVELIFLERSWARSFTRSRMLRFCKLPRLSNRLSHAREGYTSIGTGDSGLCQERCELYASEKFDS